MTLLDFMQVYLISACVVWGFGWMGTVKSAPGAAQPSKISLLFVTFTPALNSALALIGLVFFVGGCVQGILGKLTKK